jgi:hypothetical protein
MGATIAISLATATTVEGTYDAITTICDYPE